MLVFAQPRARWLRGADTLQLATFFLDPFHRPAVRGRRTPSNRLPAPRAGRSGLAGVRGRTGRGWGGKGLGQVRALEPHDLVSAPLHGGPVQPHVIPKAAKLSRATATRDDRA